MHSATSTTPDDLLLSRQHRRGLDDEYRRKAYLPMTNLSDDKIKEALKEGLKEWLDSQYASLGKWLVGAVLVGIVLVLIKFGAFPH